MRRRRHSLRYRLYLASPLWRLRRRVWIWRAGGRCQQCGSRRRLTVHHVNYRRLGHEHREDIRVWCWPCHSTHHAGRSRPLTRPRRLAARAVTLGSVALVVVLLLEMGARHQ